MKNFLILILITLLFSCENIEDEVTKSQVIVTINPVATDDVIDAEEFLNETQTVSGTATNGNAADGDSVIIIVNNKTYNTTLSGNDFSLEIPTLDIVRDIDNRIFVSVTSSNSSTGVSTVKSAVRVVTAEGDLGLRNFNHPGLLVTQADFDRIIPKVNASVEPWASGWNKLIQNPHASLSYSPSPVVKLIRGGNSREEPEPDNYSTAFNDAAAAFQTAVRWKITGDVAYAEKSIQILNAWASTNKSINGDSNIALAAGIYGSQFANAAEIMRDYDGWNSQDFEDFKTWIVDVFYKVSKDFIDTHYGTCISHYWANWDLANLSNILAISVLIEDDVMYAFVINYLKNGLSNGNLNLAINYIHPNGLGQLQESGRDQGHTLLCIGLMSDIARMAYNQGDDLYSYQDNRILKGAEYAAKYNVANQSVPFQEYYTCTAGGQTHTEISDVGRGNVRPIWAGLYNHYVVKMGLNAPNLKFAVDNLPVEGGGGDYSPNSGGYDSLGFGTLLYTEE